MRVVIYLRVSTDGQASEGTGLEVQEEACRAWARAGRHRVVAVCTDAGRSGMADHADRPGLAEALGHLVAEVADGIVVARLDRLARDQVLQEQLLAEVLRLGGELHSCSPTEDASLLDDENDPTRALIRRIIGAVSQYEREVIRLRLRAGAAKRLASTGYAGGKPPYGWRSERGGGLVAVEEEQLVVGRILELREMGLSLRAIGEQLLSEGMKPKSPAEVWRPATIQAIILRGTERPDYRVPVGASHAAS